MVGLLDGRLVILEGLLGRNVEGVEEGLANLGGLIVGREVGLNEGKDEGKTLGPRNQIRRTQRRLKHRLKLTIWHRTRHI